jgi:fluoroacetyl-CoA thioesterase
MSISPGLIGEMRFDVQPRDTASALAGSSLPPVLSTPHLVGLIETTAHRAIQPFLEAGQSSVGSLINIKHLAATPVGMQIRIRVELAAVDGRKLRFDVEAWDEVEKIAEGEHERFIIDSDRFTEKVEKKKRAGEN